MELVDGGDTAHFYNWARQQLAQLLNDIDTFPEDGRVHAAIALVMQMMAGATDEIASGAIRNYPPDDPFLVERVMMSFSFHMEALRLESWRALQDIIGLEGDEPQTGPQENYD